MVKKSNTVEVIGAGWGRTSLKKALEILGYDKTYHMHEVFQHSRAHGKFWCRVADKKPYDFDEIFCENGKPKYRASCDFPSSQYWREQLEQYPEAKVILTTRDPEKWYKSTMDTILLALSGSPNQYFGLKFLDLVDLGIMKKEFWLKTITRDAFHYQFDKQSLITGYKEHNEKVLKECPKEKLLVYNVEEGWEPLCKFLNKPIPSEPFPHLNDTKEFQGNIMKGCIVGYVLMTMMVLLPVGIGYLTMKLY
jgi:hypothetical protein